MRNQNHRPVWLLGVLLTVLLALACAAALAEDIPVDGEHFPDEQFRAAVKQYIDQNRDDKLTADEISNGKTLLIGSDLKIESCAGLQYLTGLEYFQCTSCEKITSLDLSSNPALTFLNCVGCDLTELNLSGCAALETVMCYDNSRLATLRLPESAPLKSLLIGKTALSVSEQGVNIYRYPNLEYIDVNRLGLTSLDAGAFPHLKTLMCSENQLEQLDLSANGELEYCLCRENRLKELNLKANPKLENLQCGGNQLQQLDLSANPLLYKIECAQNQLGELDVSPCAGGLEDLSCEGNGLTQLILGDAKKLRELNCADNSLTALKLSSCTNLWLLNCANNQLTGLALPKTARLSRVYCYGNAISTLDVHECPELVKTYKSDDYREQTMPSGKIICGWVRSPIDEIWADASVEIIIDAPVYVQSISLGNKTATLTRTGKQPKPTLTLKATVSPADADNPALTWQSSNTKVATVDKSGKVTALKAGKVTITCAAADGSGVKAVCTLKVEDAKVTKVTLNKTKAKLKVGKTLQLKVKKFTPASPLNTKVKWTTSNKKVATVDKNGKVKAKKAGTAVITCTSQDNKKVKAKCTITVK